MEASVDARGRGREPELHAPHFCPERQFEVVGADDFDLKNLATSYMNIEFFWVPVEELAVARDPEEALVIL